MKSSNVIDLEPCPKCGEKTVFASYEENRRYKYKCACGQYFEFNAPSQFAADTVYNFVSGAGKERKAVLNNGKRA